MPAPSRRSRFAGAVVAILTAALCASALPPAFAQPDATATIELVGQPVWHDPEDPLALRLRVSNLASDTLEGFRLQVRVYGAARTRSDLHNSFEIDSSSVESSSLPVEFLDTDVVPGSSTAVEIADPVSALPSLAAETEGGVYPLTVTLTDAQGFTSLDSITTQLLYFPSNVETPLNLVLMWPLADIPSRSAGGRFQGDPVSGETAIEQAMAERGWLTGITGALAGRAGQRLRFGLAPGPRLIDELRDMADGYTRVTDGEPTVIGPNEDTSRGAAAILDRFRALLENDNLQPVLAPYALPDLPSLEDLEHANAQLTAAESALDVLGRSVGRAWVFPPGGRLDEPTLEGLRSSDAAASTFLAAESLEPPAPDATSSCREDFEGITYTCPVILTTTAGRARGFVLDPELQQRFGALVGDPGDRVAMQRLFAELAMIWAELPGTERVVALAAPPLWHPPPGVASMFVRTISQGPWLRSRTPRGGLHLGIGAAERALVGDALNPRSAPDDDYVGEVRDAAEIVESFARMRPPEPLIQRLRRDVLVAESRLWWGDASSLAVGESYATGAREEVERELAKISIGGRRNVTLTSRRGEVPLLLVNDTGYEVSLEVQLVAEGRDIEISEDVIRGSFPPGTSPLPFEASARSSGGFRVRVRVQTADGYPVHETFISVRSTEFNEIALGITVGALAFLILFYVFRGVRRRRLAHEGETSE